MPEPDLMTVFRQIIDQAALLEGTLGAIERPPFYGWVVVPSTACYRIVWEFEDRHLQRLLEAIPQESYRGVLEMHLCSPEGRAKIAEALQNAVENQRSLNAFLGIQKGEPNSSLDNLLERKSLWELLAES